ncbi:MAG: hypothetical protein ACK56I_23095, partial [bacterium]
MRYSSHRSHEGTSLVGQSISQAPSTWVPQSVQWCSCTVCQGSSCSRRQSGVQASRERAETGGVRRGAPPAAGPASSAGAVGSPLQASAAAAAAAM